MDNRHPERRTSNCQTEPDKPNNTQTIYIEELYYSIFCRIFILHYK